MDSIFLTPWVVGERPPFPLNLRLKWPIPYRTTQFLPGSAHSVITVRAGQKISISTNRKSTTRFPTSHRWTVYRYVTAKSPPTGGTKRDFAIFPSKFQLLSNKVCYKLTKFLCVKTSSSSNVVTTSNLYLTVHRWIAGDVHIYLKFALKWLTPSENAHFNIICLIVP